MKFLPLLLIAASSVAFVYLNQPATVQQDEEMEIDEVFFKFIMEHGKSYKSTDDFKIRSEQFRKNLGEIKSLQKKISHEIGINYLADWTDEEYKARLNFQQSGEEVIDQPSSKNLKQFADYKDWKEEGYVTPVKDQGTCGSCWAFSAIASFESNWAIKKDLKGEAIPEPAAQQLVDCCKVNGCDACNGGRSDNAMIYMTQTKIALESEYPYNGIERTCNNDTILASKTTIPKLTESRKVRADSSGIALIEEIQFGPIAISIDASGKEF